MTSNGIASGSIFLRSTFRPQKAVRDPDLQNLTWLLPFISTGEKPLDDPNNESARPEGAQVRMAPIPVPPGADGGIFNRLDGSREKIVEQAYFLVREDEETLAETYGVAILPTWENCGHSDPRWHPAFHGLLIISSKGSGLIPSRGSDASLRNSGSF